MNKKTVKKFFSASWFVLLLIIVFFLRIPSLFEPFAYADEGIYLTLGQAFKKGLVLYREIHDNKPPLIYILGGISGSFFIYRLMFFFWSFATIILFYKLTKRIFNQKSCWLTILPNIIFAILISLPMFEGNIANAENFMLFPIIGGFYLVFNSIGKNKTNKISLLIWLLSGILFSFAFLFKVPALFDFLVLVALGIILITKKNLKATFLNITSASLGFFLPILVTIIYFAQRNALGDYLKSALLQNLPYLSSWTGAAPTTSGLPTLIISRFLIVAIITLAVYVLKDKISLTTKFIVLWFAFSLFAALLSSRPYPHYLIQAIPALSLSFAFLFYQKNKKWLKIVPVIFLITGGLAFWGFKFWYYDNVPYFNNFYKYILGQKTKEDYFKYFGQQTEDIYQTAEFIRNHTDKKEKFFIWGTQPSIYSLSKRLPIGKYTVSYHIIDFDGHEETILSLSQNPPRWIVVTGDEKRSFEELETILDYDYTLYKVIGKNKIFYHIPKISRL